jgi:hypothetical protein
MAASAVLGKSCMPITMFADRHETRRADHDMCRRNGASR